MMHLMTLALVAAQTTASAQTGVTRAAPATAKGEPATFDLAGFRLGMSEEEVDQVIRTRGLTVRRSSRATTFEDTVRGLVNVRGGRLEMHGGSVLDTVDLDDGKGGKVMLRMLGWPVGARVRSVAFLPPAGTEPAAWRSLLIERFGAPGRDSDTTNSEGVHLTWCGKATCSGEGAEFRLTADVNALGGQIVLSQPEGTAQMLGELVEDAAARRTTGKPAF